ncbi:MAG: hypothetical protein L3K03_00205 [Thermoplasmata archaeon]|nr:hypothetical protein [Thermoplasmata archaeon]
MPRSASPRQIESFLLDHLRDHPRLRYRELVRATVDARRGSERTAARALAGLVELGEVVQLADASYAMAGSSEAPFPVVLERQWLELWGSVQADGSYWSNLSSTSRVVQGRLEFAPIVVPGGALCHTWWSSHPHRIRQVSPDESDSGLPMEVMEYREPLTARNRDWVRHTFEIGFPPVLRMWDGAPGHEADETRGVDARYESARFLEPSQPRPGVSYRFSPDAHFRMRLLFPPGYPFGEASLQVQVGGSGSRSDAAEVARIEALGRDPQSPEGLRRIGSTLSLSVPHPRLDRSYRVRWRLPSRAAYLRWLSSSLHAPGGRTPEAG